MPNLFRQHGDRSSLATSQSSAGSRPRIRPLLGHVQVFLAEKHFEGCGGLELTDEIRVTIAAQACLLLLHRATDYYPQLTSILVYPSGYTSYEARHLEGNIWDEGGEPRLGQTTRLLGSLVLAWDDAKRGAAHPSDGRNLVLHEFAHQLDYEDSRTDGAPALTIRAEYLAWARVMSKEFAALQSADEAGTPTVLDTYGATNPPVSHLCRSSNSLYVCRSVCKNKRPTASS